MGFLSYTFFTILSSGISPLYIINIFLRKYRVEQTDNSAYGDMKFHRNDANYVYLPIYMAPCLERLESLLTQQSEPHVSQNIFSALVLCAMRTQYIKHMTESRCYLQTVRCYTELTQLLDYRLLPT
jgi:hypothetical protein